MTPPGKRMQSQTERDLEGLAARRERHSAPVEIPEEVTGQYEGEDLARARARRPTPERLSRLEEKHDSLVRIVTDTRVDVAGIRGELKALPRLVDLIESMSGDQQKTKRVHYTSSARVRIALFGVFTTALGIISALLAKGCS